MLRRGTPRALAAHAATPQPPPLSRHPSAATPQPPQLRGAAKGAVKGAAKGQRRPALAEGAGNAAMAVTRLHVVFRRLCRSVDRWVSSSATTLLLTSFLTYTLLCHSSVPGLAGSFLIT